jgi:hypothetical protein
MEVYKACPLWPNLEDASRGHPDTSAAARALRLRPRSRVQRTLIVCVFRKVTRPLPTARTKAIRDSGNRDHRRLTMVDGLTVDMADAQTALEEFCN